MRNFLRAAFMAVIMSLGIVFSLAVGPASADPIDHARISVTQTNQVGADPLAVTGAPVEMQRQNTSARPALPPGGWWRQAYPGCEAYVTNHNVVSSLFRINGRNYGFRRGPSCNYGKKTGDNNSTWVDM